jgi:lysophospholipase L1-like esterase
MPILFMTGLLLCVFTACSTPGNTPGGAQDGGRPATDAGADAGPTWPDAAHAPGDAAQPDGARDAAVTLLPDAARADSAAPDAATPDAAGPLVPDAGGSDATVDAGSIGHRCFPQVFDSTRPSPIYDQFQPQIGTHCLGTNHQDIQGVERVVFVGDSVTVGTPPTQASDFYRSRLADALVQKFNLDAPDFIWRSANPISGEAGRQESGDFASCAKWGARADDFLRDHDQLETCLPQDQRSKRTLLVFTIGGNDIAALQKDGVHAPYAQSRAQVEWFVGLLRAAVEWVKAPGRFPNGVFVVFGNMYEFTDGTGDVSSCPAASVGGFSEPWDDPPALEELVIWANEQFMSIAKDTGSDMIFLLEAFCGHGFKNNDPTNRCYRGPNTPRWFDVSCIHPTPEGHAQIAQMFMSVVNE